MYKSLPRTHLGPTGVTTGPDLKCFRESYEEEEGLLHPTGTLLTVGYVEYTSLVDSFYWTLIFSWVNQVFVVSDGYCRRW